MTLLNAQEAAAPVVSSSSSTRIPFADTIKTGKIQTSPMYLHYRLV